MWPARDVGRLSASCTLLLVLSGPILVPPVLYSAMAASAGVAQAHVTALLPAAYAVGSLLTSVPGSLFMERFGLRCSFVLGAALQADARCEACCATQVRTGFGQSSAAASHRIVSALQPSTICATCCRRLTDTSSLAGVPHSQGTASRCSGSRETLTDHLVSLDPRGWGETGGGCACVGCAAAARYVGPLQLY